MRESKGKGYVGKSMSVNAQEAYDRGEKPISKWTKKAIIEEILNENYNDLDIVFLENLTLKTLKSFLEPVCYHHTGMFFDETLFYKIDSEKVENLTDDDIFKLLPKSRQKQLQKSLEVKKLFAKGNRDIDIVLEAIRQDVYNFTKVENQTEELCLEIVKINGLALEFVKNQTEKICLEAVKQNGLALEFVKNQTEKICLEAVKQGFAGFDFVKQKTKAIWLAYVINHEYRIPDLPDEFKTEDVYLEIVKENPQAIRFLRDNKTEKICLEAAKRDGLTINYFSKKERTFEVCLEAVRENREALNYIKKSEHEKILKALNLQL